MSSLSVRPIPIYGKQGHFLQASEWLRGFVGGRGTGKTWIGSFAIATQAVADDPWMCISPDAGVVHDTTLPTFLEVVEQMGVHIRDVKSPYPRVWWRTQDGGIANMVFRSAEKPEKLRGPSKAGLWIDEASVQNPAVFNIATATLRHRRRMGPCFMTFTPKGRTHWTFDKFFQLVDEAMIGTDGCSADGLEWIQGRPYRRKKGTSLTRAHTRDNPFLPPEYYDVMAGQYSSTFAAQELAGDFVDIAGLMFQRYWFELIDQAPRDAMRVRYWDKAATPGDGCYTAGVLMARDSRGIFYVEDVVRGQWSYHQRDTIIEQTAERDARKYSGEVLIIAEQEGGSGGKEVAHQMITRMAGFPVFRDNVSGTTKRIKDGMKLPGEAKIVRASPLAGQAEAGNVKIVRGDWNADFLDEVTAFPESTYSDQVDATSGALNKLAGKMFTTAPPAEKAKVEVNSERFGVAAVLERARTRRLYGTESRR